MGIRKIKNKIQVDISKYVNRETGEILVDEMSSDTKMTIIRDSGLVSVSYSDYAVISTDAIIYLTTILNNSDLGNVLKMLTTTKTPLNILYNNNVPHSNSSLQQYLKVSSESKFIDLIKRLMKLGVLYQIKGNIYGSVRVIYMLNPFLSKKRKLFDDKVFKIFKNFQVEIESKEK